VVVARHRDGPVRYREDAPVEAAAAAFGVPLQELDLAASDAASAADAMAIAEPDRRVRAVT
jgi:hypothetical protein